MDDKENRRSMQLVKARFRSIDNVFTANVDVQPDGTYAAERYPQGHRSRASTVVAVVDKQTKSQPMTFENKIAFPNMYLANAGTSLNLMYPFVLTLAVVAIFGVLMGAGGASFSIRCCVTLFPALPHTVVAGTVTPTVLFSQGSGIVNYSKIKFINWKLGCGIGTLPCCGVVSISRN